MRIILLLSSLYTGGAEFSTLSFYGWLKLKGFDIKLICYKNALPAYDPKVFGLTDAIILEEKKFLGKLKTLDQIVNEFKPVLIHSVLFEANILGRFCKFNNRKIIHLESLVNEMYSPHRLHDPRVNSFKLKAYQIFDFVTQVFGVDHFHANGFAVAAHYQKKLMISKQRITIIPRGRVLNPFLNNKLVRHQIRAELMIPDDDIVLIQVARHEYQKAQDILLRAFAKIPKNQNLFCLLVGREGNLTALIKKEIEANNLQEHVKLLGHRGDIAQLLIAADVFVFPSRFEGLPGALIEAEAAGLPIICSDIANNREVAIENENALFFKVDDELELSQKLSLMIHSKSMCEEMGKKSLLIFKDKFELKEIHERMKDLLESLINDK
jgi:glycosyltransferase involved in cell wall biosynthesis